MYPFMPITTYHEPVANFRNHFNVTCVSIDCALERGQLVVALSIKNVMVCNQTFGKMMLERDHTTPFFNVRGSFTT